MSRIASSCWTKSRTCCARSAAPGSRSRPARCKNCDPVPPVGTAFASSGRIGVNKPSGPRAARWRGPGGPEGVDGGTPAYAGRAWGHPREPGVPQRRAGTERGGSRVGSNGRGADRIDVSAREIGMYEGVDTVVLHNELAYEDVLPVGWRPLVKPLDLAAVNALTERNLRTLQVYAT